ncbi:hypothetical protein Acid345_3101 [Candidatus Koribacter versatilis Ellin345]|uniref:Tetratricopeptide repeat protein n=1 Tax=Koribacter versatilis (strain Ellin345) TaxID=204669 RepID=Q1ILZ8_KORVE|nr:hypothetical protein [Candidatus Koribacter versatilis]ABF42102.1 hypothetical protein Acid345_3101 [Candidatus Koribacter versatilis Ellin345]
MKLGAILLTMAVVGATAAPAVAICGASSQDIEIGYRQMYNLDFATAHKTFATYENAHPDDPLAHVSNAAAYLFGEFDRMHVLEIELFADNSHFEKREKVAPDPATRDAFEHELAVADGISMRRLAKSANDAEALFAQILANGLRGDYEALIEKKNLASLTYMKASRGKAEQLLSLDPHCYDAYLAVGVENYLLGINPAPVRWVLRMTGAQTDKADGIQKLQLTAEKGDYLAPFARLLLAVAAVREKDPVRAKELLSGLAQEFPQNHLYAAQLARIH